MTTSDRLVLNPVRHLSGEVALPGSKSISNRALLLAAQASGTTELTNLLDSEDTQVMRQALDALGVHVERHGGIDLVQGRGGALCREASVDLALNLGLAGTAYRPLAAALCTGRGTFVLDGIERMRERPVGDLVDALVPLGAHISYLRNTGFPPIRIQANGLTGGETRIRGDVSSQFLTSLLMAAPLARSPVRVHLTTELTSKPYIDITLSLMARFGVEVQHSDYDDFRIEPTPYSSPGRFLVEGDASSASYFLAAGAIRGGGITVRGIGAQSVQGDVRFVEVLKQMGAHVSVLDSSISVGPAPLRGIDVDLNHIPDAAMTVAVLALFAEGTTTIRNIANWRVKETDRLSAMATELRKLGAVVEEGADSLSVTPPEQLQSAEIDTYGDHRMAMCFSLAALGGVPVTIRDPACVGKTFPDYFEVFARLAA